MRLEAARVWVSREGRTLQVTFTDSVDSPGTTITVARRLAPDPTLSMLGMDGVYIEIDGTDCAAWQAASSYTLDGATLRIVVSQAALSKLGLNGDIVIELAEPLLKSEDLRTALAAIFAIEPRTA